jgi:TonB family protein
MKYLSFPIALAIHLAVFFAIAFFMDTNQEQVIDADGANGSPRKNLIDVSFGSGVKKTSLDTRAKKTVTASSNDLSHTSGTTPTAASSEVSGTSAGNGAGEASGYSPFDSNIVSYSEPIYPKVALKRSLEGEVKLSLKISESGEPQEVQVQKSSGAPILDESAKVAAMKWRFQQRPGIGHYLVEKTVVFKLRN